MVPNHQALMDHHHTVNNNHNHQALHHQAHHHPHHQPQASLTAHSHQSVNLKSMLLLVILLRLFKSFNLLLIQISDVMLRLLIFLILLVESLLLLKSKSIL